MVYGLQGHNVDGLVQGDFGSFELVVAIVIVLLLIRATPTQIRLDYKLIYILSRFLISQFTDSLATVVLLTESIESE